MEFVLDYNSSKGEDAIFTALERVLKEDEITSLCMNDHDLEIILKNDYKVVIKDYNSFVLDNEYPSIFNIINDAERRLTANNLKKAKASYKKNGINRFKSVSSKIVLGLVICGVLSSSMFSVLESAEAAYVPTSYKSVDLGYSYDVNEIYIAKAKMYENLVKKYSDKYGIDANLVLAVIARNGAIDSNIVDDNNRVGIMQVDVPNFAKDFYNIYNYETNNYENISNTEDDLLTLEGNIEAWCVGFKNLLSINYYNIFAALELINTPYKDIAYKKISSYADGILKKFGESNDIDSHTIRDNEEAFNYRVAVDNYNDLGWLDSFKDEEGIIYSCEVLSYLPNVSSIIIKSPKGNIEYIINKKYEKKIK